MKSVTLADHGERKKEKAALPNRSDRRQAGRRSHPRRALSTRDRGGGSPTRPPSPLFHPRGLAAPARRATRAPSVRRAPQPLPGLAFPERYRLEMRAPATATWKTQGFSPFPTLSAEFGTHAGLGADSRRASAAPTPQSAGAWDRGLCTERAAASAQAGRAPGRADPRAALRISPGKLGAREWEATREKTPLPTGCTYSMLPKTRRPRRQEGGEPNAPHRDRGFAPTPLRWILFSQRGANNSSPDANFCPFFPNSASVQLRGNRRELKRRGESGAKSPAD